MAVYRIADVNMSIHPVGQFTRDLLKEYQVDNGEVQLDVPTFADSDTEYADILRYIAQAMLHRFEGMYMHSAAVLYENKVYLFVAPSGTGKSTHIALWKQLLRDRVTVLNGDKPILRRREGKIYVYGTPWRGKEGWGSNAKGELGGIYLLQRSSDNYIKEIPFYQAVGALVGATIYPTELDGRTKVLDFLELMAAQAKVAELHCNADLSAVRAVLAHIETGACI